MFDASAGHFEVAKQELATSPQGAEKSYTYYIEDVQALCRRAQSDISEADGIRQILKCISSVAFNAFSFTARIQYATSQPFADALTRSLPFAFRAPSVTLALLEMNRERFFAALRDRNFMPTLRATPRWCLLVLLFPISSTLLKVSWRPPEVRHVPHPLWPVPSLHMQTSPHAWPPAPIDSVPT